MDRFSVRIIFVQNWKNCSLISVSYTISQDIEFISLFDISTMILTWPCVHKAFQNKDQDQAQVSK